MWFILRWNAIGDQHFGPRRRIVARISGPLFRLADRQTAGPGGRLAAAY
jgi:hypothetical protein